MKIKEILKVGLHRLNSAKTDSYCTPELDSLVLLMEVLKKDKIYMFTHDDEEVSENSEKIYLDFIEKRSQGIPLQYIVKKQEFMGFDFFVDEGVLIPRGDTEILIEKIIEISSSMFAGKEKIKILEIGTGSGAIAISLAKFIDNSEIISMDISEKAIDISRKNVSILEVANVEIIEQDVFEDLSLWKNKGPFDILVSNPPYIESHVIDSLQREVKDFEPMLALDGGEDGLIFYDRIAAIAKDLLSEDGFVAVEIGHNQGDAVKKLFEGIGGHISEVEVVKDLAGLDRVVIGK